MLKNNLSILILLSLFAMKVNCSDDDNASISGTENVGGTAASLSATGNAGLGAGLTGTELDENADTSTNANLPTTTEKHKPIAAFLYGAVVDVTDKIKDYSGQTIKGYEIFSDPAPQILKQIAIIYEGDDSIKPENISEKEINEAPWSIKVPVIDPNKKIVAAVYGAFNDITDQVQYSGQKLVDIQNPAGFGVGGSGVLPQDRRIVIIYKDEKLKPENILPAENQTCAYGKCNFTVPKLEAALADKPAVEDKPAPSKGGTTGAKKKKKPAKKTSASTKPAAKPVKAKQQTKAVTTKNKKKTPLFNTAKKKQAQASMQSKMEMDDDWDIVSKQEIES